MKKYDLLKVLGITFLIIVLISWVIPAGIYSNGSFTSLDMTVPIGLFDIVTIPLLTFNNFAEFGLLLLAIGGFYGVLNKTGAYSRLVENVVDKWKNKNKKFLIITTIVFSLLSSVIGLTNLLFILVPFFITVLLKLGFNKLTTFAATVGSLLVGQIGSIIGSETWGYADLIFGSLVTDFSMFDLILVRVILWLIVTALFVLIVNKTAKNTVDTKEIKEEVKDSKKSKKDSKKEEIKEESKVEIPLYEKVTTKKDILPLAVILIIMLILLMVGLYKWTYIFDLEIFTTIHEQITEFEINGYPILSNILGSITQLGEWNNYTVIFILIAASLVITWLYSIKFSEAFDGFVKGIKEMLLPALYAVLSCVVFAAVLSLSTNFVYTIVNQFVGEEFSLIGTVASSIVTSFTYNVFPQMINSFAVFFSSFEVGTISVVALIFQTIFGLVMLIAPTSIFLLAGLSYLKIPYKEWIKFIWKFCLVVFGVIIVIAFITTALI